MFYYPYLSIRFLLRSEKLMFFLCAKLIQIEKKKLIQIDKKNTVLGKTPSIVNSWKILKY